MQSYKNPEHRMMSAEQYLLYQHSVDNRATYELTWILSAIMLASKHIATYVRRVDLTDVALASGVVNVHGETVQKMDEIADKMLIESLGMNADVAVISSEENETPVILRESGGKYIVFFDPLDGSSNTNVGVPVGTIFSIMEKNGDQKKNIDDIVLLKGDRQLAAGYILYGSSTVLVYSMGNGVHMFTLDPNVGDYLLSKENMIMPESSKIYSINEGNAHSFSEGTKRYLDWVKSDEAGPYSSRYIGSLVADFHRTLIKGGIFLYPATAKSPEGKLRLMYEANPMAFLAEQAGGLAINGEKRILDIQPQSLHQRVPLIVGSKKEVEKVQKFL